MKNPTLIKLAKNLLKELLAQCTEAQQMTFKRMYAHTKLDLPINEGIDKMDVDKIDHAITQVERSIENNNKRLEEKYK